MSIAVRLIGAGLLTAVLGACGSSTAPSAPLATATPRASPGATSTASMSSTSPASGSAAPPAIDLSAIVLGPDDPPPGMSHDETITGPEALTMVVISGSDAEFEALGGFVDGRGAFFSGEGGALLMLALAFDEPVAADLAAHRYQRELSSADGYGFGDGQPTDFAFEGICDTGTHPAFPDLEESICIWHAGPVVLIVGGPIPRQQLEGIAREMDARAEPYVAAP